MSDGVRRGLRSVLAVSLLFGGTLFAVVASGQVAQATPTMSETCVVGLKPQVLTATYGTSTFSGLFCVNPKNGVGTYTQGSVSGVGAITTVKGTTVIGAVGKGLALAGATNGTKSAFVEVAPVLAVGTFTLSLPTPTITTVAQPASATAGTAIADQATVAGGDNPTGTVTFNLYSNATATGPALFTDTESLSGGTATSAGYTATAAGTDYWVATYNGDTNNNPVTGDPAAEPVTITKSASQLLCESSGGTFAVGVPNITLWTCRGWTTIDIGAMESDCFQGGGTSFRAEDRVAECDLGSKGGK
jgi:hypothetical protein